MVMVIECQACKSRFRLDRALFKESKAIRVRCRKCGGYIVVGNPDLAETAPDNLRPVPGAVPEPEPEPPSLPPSPPVPEDESMRAMADLLREFRSEPEPEPEPEQKAPAPPLEPGTPYPEPPDGSEALASILEDLFKPSPPQGPGPEPVSAKEDDFRKGEARRRALPRETDHERPVRPPYKHPLFVLVAVLWLLLMAGAAFLFGTGQHRSWFGPKRTWSPSTPAPDNLAAGFEFDISEVKYFTDNAYDGGKLFAVTGTVTNLGEPMMEGIRIRAMLMGKDNEVLSERTVYAGNRIDNSMLRHTRRDVVEDFLAQAAEKGSMNREIPKGESVPFMAVFFDPPEKIESVLVKAVPAESR